MKKSADDHTNKLHEKLLHISKRPGMYGANRVEDINLMLTGAWFLGNADDAAIVSKFTDEFNKYTRTHYKDTVSIKKSYDWWQLIRLHALSSDKLTLESFANLFQSYLSSKS